MYCNNCKHKGEGHSNALPPGEAFDRILRQLSEMPSGGSREGPREMN